MDMRSEISEFLKSRRARVSPASVGFGTSGVRRVPGLRREEVAVLASVSVEYYVRMERGILTGVSDEVLDAVVIALQLDEAEAMHLRNLARLSHPTSSSGTPTTSIDPSLLALLDALVGVPARVRNHRFELIAVNPLARAVYAQMIASPVARGNSARYIFLDPAAAEFYPDWSDNADDIVATMRSFVGEHPTDRGLSNLIGELATQSDEFARRWAKRNVGFHRRGVKRLHHDLVGELRLQFRALSVPEERTLTVFAYLPADDETAERLDLLGSWSANSPTTEPPASDDSTDSSSPAQSAL